MRASIPYQGNWPLLSGGAKPPGGIADYSAKGNWITKVLDFIQFGGPNLTIDSTVFEMEVGL